MFRRGVPPEEEEEEEFYSIELSGRSRSCFEVRRRRNAGEANAFRRGDASGGIGERGNTESPVCFGRKSRDINGDADPKLFRKITEKDANG